DPLLEYLECPPSGDVRTLYWHARPGMGKTFAHAFKQRFGEWFLLVRTSDAEALGMFGRDLLPERVRARLGDYVSLALGREVLRYTGAPGRERYLAQRSHHSGLSPAEMNVPFILIRTESGGAQPDLDFSIRPHP